MRTTGISILKLLLSDEMKTFIRLFHICETLCCIYVKHIVSYTWNTLFHIYETFCFDT